MKIRVRNKYDVKDMLEQGFSPEEISLIHWRENLSLMKSDDFLSIRHYDDTCALCYCYGYNYDDAGNRKRLDLDSNQYFYTYYPGSNRLEDYEMPSGTIRLDYDSCGNMIKKTRPGGDVENFSYNWNNRLVGAESSSLRFDETYSYDFTGQRIKKTE